MTIHDHFDGSAHCLECRGHCTLTGRDLDLTRVIRNLFEYFEFGHNGWMPPTLQGAIEGLLGARLVTFRQRCKESFKELRERGRP
jgi:hypothetical protein